MIFCIFEYGLLEPVLIRLGLDSCSYNNLEESVHWDIMPAPYLKVLVNRPPVFSNTTDDLNLYREHEKKMMIRMPDDLLQVFSVALEVEE